VTIGICSAEAPSEPLFTHMVETTSQSTFDWVWDGMIPSENPLLPGHPAEVGAYTFKVEANCSGDVGCDKSSHLTVSETDAEWANDYQEEAEYPCAFTVTYRLTDTPAGQGAEAATVQVIDLSPTTALCGETAGTLLEGMNSVVVRTREMGCLHSYLVCATYKHPDDDKGHRNRFALPHNQKKAQPQASCYGGHPLEEVPQGVDVVPAQCLQAAGYNAAFLGKYNPGGIADRLRSDSVMFIFCHGLPGLLIVQGEHTADELEEIDPLNNPPQWFRENVLRSQRPRDIEYGPELSSANYPKALLAVLLACHSADAWVEEGTPGMCGVVTDRGAKAATGFHDPVVFASIQVPSKWAKTLFRELTGQQVGADGKLLPPGSRVARPLRQAATLANQAVRFGIINWNMRIIPATPSAFSLRVVPSR